MMSKKILSVILTITMIATLFSFGSVVASADEAIHAGDVVEYTFYIKNLNEVGGVSADLRYNSEYLTARTGDDYKTYRDGQPVVNAETVPNTVCWNMTFNVFTGENFADEAVMTLYFDVVKDGSISDAGFEYEAWELFDKNLVMYEGAEYVYGKAEVVCNHDVTTDTETDTETETDIPTDTDTETETDVPTDTDTETETDIATETDTETETDVPTDTDTTTDTDTESETDSEPVVSSDKESDKDSEKDSDKDSEKDSDKDTKDTASKTSSKTTSKTTTTTTVQTAGTVAVISLVVVLMAAAAVVLFSKKRADQE